MDTSTGEIRYFASPEEARAAGFDRQLTYAEARELMTMSPAERITIGDMAFAKEVTRLKRKYERHGLPE